MGDRGLIARLGGDEFAVLIEHLEADGGANALAGELLEALDAPIVLRGGQLYVRASIGVAVAADPETTDELLAHADVAMYAVKAMGKRAFRRYDDGLQPEGRCGAGVDAVRGRRGTGARRGSGRAERAGAR